MAEYAKINKITKSHKTILVVSKNDYKYSGLCLKPWKNFIDEKNVEIIYVCDYNFFYYNLHNEQSKIKTQKFVIHVTNALDLRHIKKKIKNCDMFSYEHGISDIFYLYNLKKLYINRINLISLIKLKYQIWKWPINTHVSLTDLHKREISRPTIKTLRQSDVFKSLVALNVNTEIPRVDVVILLDKIDLFDSLGNESNFLEFYLRNIMSDINLRFEERNYSKIKVLIKSRPHSKLFRNVHLTMKEEFIQYEFLLAENYVDIFEPLEFIWPHLQPKLIYSNGLSAPYFLKNLGFNFHYINTTELLISALKYYNADINYINLIKLEYKRNHELLKSFEYLFPKTHFIKSICNYE